MNSSEHNHYRSSHRRISQRTLGNTRTERGIECFHVKTENQNARIHHINNIDPTYSRPLDVHVYSDHREVGRIVEHIWKQSCGELAFSNPTRGGAKPKTSSQSQLRVLVLDLYVAWKTDPGLSIGVHLSNTAWNTNSRYNALNLSRKIPKLVHWLADQGLIHLSKGSYAGPGAKTNRTARMIAAEPLRKLFRAAKFGLEHISVCSNKECIVMHGDRGKEVEYEDNDETNEMRKELKAYNDLLARTFIDIPDQKDPFLQRSIKSGPRQGEVVRVPICMMDHWVRRIFNRNDWTCGGRFFGGWWQQVGSEFRKRIHLNGEPTVEVDYQAMHIAMLSAKHQIELTGDPYELEPGLLPDHSPREQRKLLKQLVLMAMNAKDRNSACSAFRQDSPSGSRAKSMKNELLYRLLDAFIDKHPYLSEELCSDQGIYLMNTDSRIAARILKSFTRMKVPVLCVHDSFLIGYSKARRLKLAMRLASQAETGVSIKMSHKFMGLDEVEQRNPALVDDYLEIRHRAPCDEYRIRERLFQERVAYLQDQGIEG